MRIVCICDDEASGSCVASGLIQDHEIPSHEINSKSTAVLITKHSRDLFVRQRCPDFDAENFRDSPASGSGFSLRLFA